MTMLKLRPSQSPVKPSGLKRPGDESPSRQPKAQRITTNNVHHEEEKPKFTFDQVKNMLEKILAATDKSKRVLVSHGLKDLDFNQIAVPGHSADECKELIERLIKSTRRVRTLNEVLNDINDNLVKKTYTEIIQRATLNKDNLPKRPPSAYLLYHQDRYHALKHENPLAAEVSKLVSDEWKNLSERKRREYQKKHNDLMRAYESEMRRLGLIDDVEPKRPGTARTLFIQDRMESVDVDEHSKDELSNLNKQFGAEFDALGKEDKKYWIDLAKEKLEQYKQDREEFTLSHPHLKPKPVNSQRPGPKGNASNINQRLLKANMPQPPKPPLKLYLDKKMPEGVEGEEAEDLKRKLRDKFAQLLPKKQLKFIKRAVKDKERYEQEVEQFLQEHPECEEQFKNKEVKANLTKEQWKLYHSMVENRPNLPAPTAYLYYCGKLLSDDTYSSGNDPTQRMQYASQAWRKLSSEERAQIEQEHSDSIENYISEMNVWLDKVGPERKRQIIMEEPRANPDYWRKRAKKSKKAAAKIKKDMEE